MYSKGICLPWAPQTYILKGFYGKWLGFEVAMTFIFHGSGGSRYECKTTFKYIKYRFGWETSLGPWTGRTWF